MEAVPGEAKEEVADLRCARGFRDRVGRAEEEGEHSEHDALVCGAVQVVELGVVAKLRVGGIEQVRALPEAHIFGLPAGSSEEIIRLRHPAGPDTGIKGGEGAEAVDPLFPEGVVEEGGVVAAGGGLSDERPVKPVRGGIETGNLAGRHRAGDVVVVPWHEGVVPGILVEYPVEDHHLIAPVRIRRILIQPYGVAVPHPSGFVGKNAVRDPVPVYAVGAYGESGAVEPARVIPHPDLSVQRIPEHASVEGTGAGAEASVHLPWSGGYEYRVFPYSGGAPDPGEPGHPCNEEVVCEELPSGSDVDDLRVRPWRAVRKAAVKIRHRERPVQGCLGQDRRPDLRKQDAVIELFHTRFPQFEDCSFKNHSTPAVGQL